MCFFFLFFVAPLSSAWITVKVKAGYRARDERVAPKNRKKIEWKLITDLPFGSRTDAIEKLEWYALRSKIEVFHKILKPGCKAEESKLRPPRLTSLISLFGS
ncbi:hypothetical protein GA0061098_10411 [Bradyrhizobium shewense]|uniref:Transposase DDE domain-containing protein n=1 Tax=Bradyrhizobium shewense TaxID=1761772 RepID=A0A1C3XT37_9BRAD|nr:hypothetical protein GA0061098_10411 [Bradyrhizobium shewense]